MIIRRYGVSTGSKCPSLMHVNMHCRGRGCPARAIVTTMPPPLGRFALQIACRVMVETFFKTPSRDIATQYPARQGSKPSWSGGDPGKHGAKLRWRSLNTSTASTIRAPLVTFALRMHCRAVADTQHWAGKALSPSSERWLKRATGETQIRDRSRAATVPPTARFISLQLDGCDWIQRPENTWRAE